MSLTASLRRRVSSTDNSDTSSRN